MGSSFTAAEVLSGRSFLSPEFSVTAFECPEQCEEMTLASAIAEGEAAARLLQHECPLPAFWQQA
ncbi:MAG: hypothetical protein N2110_06415 [Flavobacteriales bacterium]|nr:hypothetical protein [Flavobacteriales bacterium]MCX7768638.1 hypothetical protein [Flavobacteriales bacterium]MDW8410372.1 hypothetical protein [Flavobacteriales bacterium]